MTVPNKKISETLLEFAAPLIDSLGENPNKADLESVLRLASGIWNACVMDQWYGTTDHVEAMRDQVRHDPGYSALVEDLIERKQKVYGDDSRGITNEHVLEKNGELVVRAEARGNAS